MAGWETRWQDSLAWTTLTTLRTPKERRQHLLLLLQRYAATRALGSPRRPTSPEEESRLAHELRLARDQSFMLTWEDKITRKRIYRQGPSPKQRIFLDAPTLTKMMITSNQFGKTTAGLTWIFSAALGLRPWDGRLPTYPDGRPFRPPVRAMIAGEDFSNHHGEVTIPKLKELLPWDFMVSHVDKIKSSVIGKIYLRNGSTIKLMSYEMDPDKWEGQTYDIVLFDEPPPRHAYVGTRRGTMKQKAPIGFTFTPLKEPWIYDELYESDRSVIVESPEHLCSLSGPGLNTAVPPPFSSFSSANDTTTVKAGGSTITERSIVIAGPDEVRPAILSERSIVIVHAGMDEARHISEEAKEEFLATLDPEEREARQHGRFRHLMGLVIKNFDRERHVLGSDAACLGGAFEGPGDAGSCKYPWGYSVDPHDRKPWYVSYFFVTPRNEIVIFDEWPHFDFFSHKSYPWTLDEYAEMFAQREATLGPPAWRILDPNFGNAPKATTGTTVKEEMADRGLYFDADSNNDIEAGHILIRNAFQEDRLFLTYSTPNLQRALTHYVWEDYRGKVQDGRTWKERPEDRFKDPIDTLRYMLQQDVRYRDPSQAWKPRLPQRNMGLAI